MNDGATTSESNAAVRICLVGEVMDDQETIKAAKHFNVPILTSETGQEYALEKEGQWTTYFILKNFEGPLFDALSKSPNKVLGPPALQHFAKHWEPLPTATRPIYNFSMKGVITCFTGIRKREELTRLVNLIHSMGGSIRKDMNCKVTHLICNSAGGYKYKYAITFRLGVVRPNWVEESWQSRDQPEFMATKDEFMASHRLRVFEGQHVCFTGFPDEEHKHMEEVLRSNGGIPSTIDNADCTHVVMSATAHSPTTTSGTNTANMKLQAPFSLHLTPHHPQNPEELSPLSDTHSATSSPIYSGGAPHDDSVALGNETLFGADHNPQLMSTPVKANDQQPQDATMPQQSTPLGSAEELQQEESKRKNLRLDDDDDDEPDLGASPSTAKKDSTGGKRKRDSLESIDCSMVMPEEQPEQSRVTRSVKRLKRFNTTAKGLRRNLSFTAMKSPFTNLLRRGRSSMLETTASGAVARGEDDLTEPDCAAMIPAGPQQQPPTTNKSPTFKTPIALPPINHTGVGARAAATAAAAAGSAAAASEWRSMANSSMFEDSLCLPEIQEEEGSAVVIGVVKPEGKSASADPPAIVDEQTVQTKLDVLSSKTFVLKVDWFWYTIQNGYADESDYLFGDYLESLANTPGQDRSDLLPLSMNKRKRKRLSQKVVKEEFSTPKTTGKRRSSVSDAGLLSMSGSFLDCTVSPGKHNVTTSTTRGTAAADEKNPASPPTALTPVVKSMRFNHFMDFFQTETNYVGILDIIDTVFKEPLEQMADASPAEALLNKSEIKSIFGNFLNIHKVHKKMLSLLTQLHNNWSDAHLIGEVILRHREDLLKAYPPYINFFEQMKEVLAQCDTQNPRFHAFLKINQSKPECGRQSLQDLMIRPVQRLPSISLLLNDILKHTPKQSPDAKCLEDALTAIKEIMTYINEDKRKTEGQLALFDIFHEIENCPAQLVSSGRSFVSKCEVVELSDLCSGRGHCLMFFLFNDTLEVCKKRSRAFAAKSPNATFNSTMNQRSMQSHTMLGAAAMGSSSGAHSGHAKPYKHIKLMPLNTIRVVVDIKDTPRAFALGCRMSKENKDKYYYFNLSEDMDFDKQTYLRSLCKQMAENACRADSDKFFATVDSQELDFDVTDFNVGTLSRAFKFANRTRLKVGRAFSFNKTPSKLKRAVSTIMTSPFGSTNSLTPASQLAQMRLASCNNINEIGEIDESNVSDSSTITAAPMSVQTSRKAGRV